MKKNTIIFFVFLFCMQLCLACPNLYLSHIEKALEVSRMDGNLEILSNSNLQEELKELFLRIYENEKKYPDYVQCVTAQDSLFYAYQVIAKELYRKLYGMPREDFEFLRFPTQSLLTNREAFFSRYPSLILSNEELSKVYKTTPDHLEETLKMQERQDEAFFLRISRGEKETCEGESDDEDADDQEIASLIQVNDTLKEVSKELISVNFTMETYRSLDSAMYVFLSGKSASLASLSKDQEEYKQKILTILYELFDSLCISKAKLADCLETLIEKVPCSKLGIINQIFIPKEEVAKYMYISLSGGFLHPIYDSNFEGSYNEFQNNRQEESFRTFRNFQARVIAGALFENPRVKILRYTCIPEDAEKQYEAIVREAIDALLAPIQEES